MDLRFALTAVWSTVVFILRTLPRQPSDDFLCEQASAERMPIVLQLFDLYPVGEPVKTTHSNE